MQLHGTFVNKKERHLALEERFGKTLGNPPESRP